MPPTPPDPLSSTVATRWRVAARFKQADVIGNPRDMLTGYLKAIAWFATDESDIPKLRAFHARLLADPGIKDRIYKDEATPEEHASYKHYSVMLIRLAARIKGNANSFRVADVDDLFLAILQQYELPTGIRKSVEAASKFYAKARNIVPRGFDVVDVYEKLIAEHRKYLAVAQEAISKGRPHGSDPNAKKWRAGSFELVNTGGFGDAAMERVAKLVEEAEKLLRAKKLGGVCYGKILVSQKLANNVAAFYMPSKDEMFVRADLKTDDKTLDTVIHELAHRMEETTHKSKAGAIKTLHKIYKIQHDDTPIRVDSIPFPSPGDEIQIDTKNLWQVEKVIGQEVYLIHDSDPSRTAKTSVDGWYRMKGAPIRRAKFVSQYAKRSPSENFAVMVALYCMGKLPNDNVEDLEKILYG